MGKIIRVKHSFNAGDLITILPGMQNLYRTKEIKFIIYQRLGLKAYYYEGATSPIVNSDNEMVCMNKYMSDRLHPLIVSQEYIESFEIWAGQEYDWDIDLSRDSKWIPMPSGHIHHWAWALCPQLSCDLSVKWLNVPRETLYSDKIIINRTYRYNNPYITYFFLKEHQDKIVFAGTQDEHSKFCSDFGLDIPLIESDNFFQLAQYIAGCKGFMGCQSFLWHLADAMKVPRILELCPVFPNTFSTGSGGHGFYHQKSLEFYFKQLLNEEKSS